MAITRADKKHFPKTVFVHRDDQMSNDAEATILVTDTDMEGVEDNTVVGVYELVDVKRKKVTTTHHWED
jgi:hypothetical protein